MKKKKLPENAPDAILTRSFLHQYDGKPAQAGTEGKVVKNAYFEEQTEAGILPGKMLSKEWKFYPTSWPGIWFFVDEQDFELL